MRTNAAPMQMRPMSMSMNGLFGVMDPFVSHPLFFVLSIGAGIFLAYKMRR